MPFFTHDNLNFHYLEKGSGVPVVFEHGLGGDAEAIFALLQAQPGFRFVCLDCRGHGRTTPLGALDKLSFNSFADDLVALLDHLELERAVLGGTSMGAGVALNCALRYAKRVQGLVLQRPAWLDGPNLANLRIFASIARLIREQGPQAGLEMFKTSELYLSVAAESSHSANSLVTQFTHPRAVEALPRLERIPQDAPNRDRKEWHKLTKPTLVMATRVDPIHPFEYGQILAQEIPGAEFKELTPKSVDLAQFTKEVNSYLFEFVRRHFNPHTTNDT